MAGIMKNIHTISRCNGLYRSQKLPDAELSSVHHPFVFAICSNPGLSQDQLARRLCFNKSTVTRRLAYLEEHGYVTRVSHETDKRVLQVYPTQKMLDFLPSLRATAHEWRTAILEELSPDELDTLRVVLERIAERAKTLAGVDEMEGEE